MGGRFLLASVVGGVVYFVLGYVFYELLLGGFFEQNMGSATGVMREAPVFWALGLGQLVFAAFVVMVFQWKGGVDDFGSGAKAGALIGLLVALGWDLTMYGVSNLGTLTSTLVDPLVFLVISAIAGGVIGITLGKGGSTTAPV